MSRVQSFLKSIADGDWHLKPPAGIGVGTVHFCHQAGLVRTKRVYVTRRARRIGKVEGYRVAFRITAKGKHQIAPAR